MGGQITCPANRRYRRPQTVPAQARTAAGQLKRLSAGVVVAPMVEEIQKNEDLCL